ncbi:hypothetical protein [Vibrio harveyi]|uniref:hypothetical protein n=1 Tax=Vibrio harveyi TaxID=669 RepID=UPI003CE9C337
MSFYQNREIVFCGKIIGNAAIEKVGNAQEQLTFNLEVTETISTKLGEIKNKYFYKVSELADKGSFKAMIKSLTEGAFVETTCIKPKEPTCESINGESFVLLSALPSSTKVIKSAPQKTKGLSLFGLQF